MFDDTKSDLAESLETVVTDDTDSVHEAFLKNIEFLNLPWREPHKPLSDIYHICVKGLNSLARQLKHKSWVLQNDDSIIKNQLKNNFIQPVGPSESCEVAGSLFALPLCHQREVFIY